MLVMRNAYHTGFDKCAVKHFNCIVKERNISGNVAFCPFKPLFVDIRNGSKLKIRASAFYNILRVGRPHIPDAYYAEL